VWSPYCRQKPATAFGLAPSGKDPVAADRGHEQVGAVSEGACDPLSDGHVVHQPGECASVRRSNDGVTGTTSNETVVAKRDTEEWRSRRWSVDPRAAVDAGGHGAGTVAYPDRNEPSGAVGHIDVWGEGRGDRPGVDAGSLACGDSNLAGAGPFGDGDKPAVAERNRRPRAAAEGRLFCPQQAVNAGNDLPVARGDGEPDAVAEAN
jgi:hypothetical protein